MTKAVRIAIDTQSTFGQRTGIGQYTSMLLNALRQVAPEHEYQEINLGHSTIMRTDKRIRWQQIGVPVQARRYQSTLLHIPGFDAPLWHPCPTVLTVHDIIGWLFPKNMPPVARFYWATWLPFSIRFANILIADSEATRQDLIHKLKIPADRIHVVHLGVEARFSPQNQEAIERCRNHYQLPKRFILYVGTLEPRKGIDTLIDAFAALANRFPDIDLVLAGKKGWYWQPLFERIQKHSLPHRVHVTGYVADEDLPALYSAATVFAFPSRYEGFGLPPLEAMACGTPVVSSNSSSLPEVVGDAAILVAPDDGVALAMKLEAVLADPALHANLSAKGRIQAGRFTWTRTATETLEIYQQALGNRHARLS